MSGHSKWSSIKHKKAAKDAKRGKLFTKLIKEISVAARNGGDVNANPRLRTAVLTARAASLPNDTIERAIKKGSGQLEGQVLEEIDYEGYGPGGVAVRNRCYVAAAFFRCQLLKGDRIAPAEKVLNSRCQILSAHNAAPHRLFHRFFKGFFKVDCFQ